MYAVIRTGGKQYKVQVGDVIDVEHVAGDDGGSIELVPLLVVDDEGKVSARPSELAGAKVTASVVGHHRGEKLRVFTYKNKGGRRHHQGHRQSLTRLKVEGIDPPGKATAKARTARPAKDKDAEAKAESTAKAKDATTTKAKPTRAAAKDQGAKGSAAKQTAAEDTKPASRSGKARAKQDEEN